MTAFPVTRVDKVASVRARIGWKALTASEYQDDGYVFLSTPNIKGTAIDFENVNYISEFRYRESPELMLEPGDVLLAKDGSTLGITALVQKLPRPSTVNGSIAVLRPHSIEPAFLRYVLEGGLVQGEIQRLKDGMGVPHLFQWDIRRLPVPLPPLDVQRRIADFLDDQIRRIDRAMELRHQQEELIGRRFLSQIDLATSGFPTQRLSYVLSVLRDGTHTPPPRVAEGIPLFTAKNLRGHVLSPSPNDTFVSPADADDLDRSISPKPGDVLFSIKGTVGSVACVPDEFPRFQFERNIALFRARKGVVCSSWLYWCLRSSKVQELLPLLMGYSAQPGIYLGTLAGLDIPIPSMSDQRSISVQLNATSKRLASFREHLVASSRLLEERKRSLMTAAVTGEFDVSSASSRASDVAMSGAGGVS